jgi:hypothetical protein
MVKPIIRRRLITWAVILLILALLFSIVPIPLKINKTLSGVKWRSGVKDYSEPAEITVDGVYWKYLIPVFKDSKFSGSIVVSDVSFTSECALSKFNFMKAMDGRGSLVYNQFRLRFNAHFLGQIKQRHLFTEIVIWSFDDSEKMDIPANLSFPADSREEAVTLGSMLYGDDFRFE